MEIPDFLVARQLPQAHGLHDSPNATMHMEFLVDKEALDGSSGACGRSSRALLEVSSGQRHVTGEGRPAGYNLLKHCRGRL
jgi:hypothetical protein